ncbi:prenyltransferase/squalene oxidase repeat-containing protein [Plantactinospora sp. WMMB334]|uniref:prenyltransferase/squalene oxidase repeat-containing protein n=1 Tax=Plantactinospora sp. WMMB334 TaxID=3404119 RepID=UPI003B935F1E
MSLAPFPAPPEPALATGEPDLWCTYAAIRTLAWLGRSDRVVDPGGIADHLAGRRNSDGGYAWTRGMLSDAWATFYCTQAMTDLGVPVPVPERTGDWVRATWSGEAYAMMPGQEPDVWATHYSSRTATGVCGGDVPDRARLLAWLGRLQTPAGGLAWSPAHARRGVADVRACHYGVLAWRALARTAPVAPPWDVPALVDWLRARQAPSGGFRFAADTGIECLWATYRATAALRELGHLPARPSDCAAWTLSLRGGSGAFVRWAGYHVEDVWASFCGVGTLVALGDPPAAELADAVAGRLRALAVPGGYTYREPSLAADALTTAAAILRADPGDPEVPGWRAWLDRCQMPNEGGVMYMPARGAEVRCTLWALAAGALADGAARTRALTWLGGLQNPDGGVGYWEGRGSDMISTAAAVECVALLGAPVGRVLDTARLATFVDSCRRHGPDGTVGHGNVPGTEPTVRAGLQALRVRAALEGPDAAALASLLDRHRVAGGGYANVGNRLPDLLSTYEAVATADRHGCAVDTGRIRVLLRRLAGPGGVAWTPLTPGGGGPLADCLGVLLDRRLDGELARLPVLALS